MINRRILTAAAFALGVSALAMAAPAAAQTKWNLPNAYPTDNPHTENLALFAKDVEAATSGKLQITVHANAVLFTLLITVFPQIALFLPNLLAGR